LKTPEGIMPEEWTTLPRSSQTYFILASGFSLSHYPRNFLEDLMGMGIVVGVNDVALDHPCHYNVRKSFLIDEGVIPESLPKYNYSNKNCKLVISEHNRGSKKQGLNTDVEGDYFFFKHRQNQSLWGIEFPDPENNEILVSWTTTTSAIHFAAKMGAKLIIVIGHDLRSGNYKGYSTERTLFVRGPSYWKFRGQAIKTQQFIHENYDSSVAILSPFMGIGYTNNRWPRYKDKVVQFLEIVRVLPKNTIIGAINIFRGVKKNENRKK
jgi:hypothetical protein